MSLISLVFLSSYLVADPVKIAFTSCIWHHDESVWNDIGATVIEEYKPHTFIFLGDIVYSDMTSDGFPMIDYSYRSILPEFLYPIWFEFNYSTSHFESTLKTFQSSTFYRNLTHYFSTSVNPTHLPKNINGIHGILAIWDDHDYGYNDGGAWHPKKVMAKQIFQKAFGVPPSPTPSDTTPGIYGSYSMGSDASIQIILLDIRSFKTPHFELSKTHNPTILGSAQWAWLKKELEKPAKIRLIGSTIPVLPENIFKWMNNQWHPVKKERWSLFGSERDRLLNLLAQTDGHIILLSGDWHFADISSITWKNKTIYELTAGGWHTDDPSFNGYKGLRKRFKHQYSIPSVQADVPPSAWQNFGTVTIDWDRSIIRLSSYTRNGIREGYDISINL